MLENEILSHLKNVLDERRFTHTMGVAQTCEKLAEFYGYSKEKARLAALLHDCAKNIDHDTMKKLVRKYKIRLDHVSKREPKLLHAYVGASLANDFYGCDDPVILDAIYYHTTGKKDMSLLCKILFLADAIEPTRRPRPILDEMREMAYKDLDRALIMAFDDSTSYILSKGELIHLDTLKARNYLLEYKRKD